MSTMAGEVPRRRAVWAWISWDAGAAAFNAVIFTFVFSVYLTDHVGGDRTGVSASTLLGWSLGVAGFLLAVTAPVSGRRADARGHRKRLLAALTTTTIVLMVAMFFVRDRPDYLWLGLVLLASASVVSELANVPYNAMLRQVSTPATQGRVSGIGWSAGYVGGVILLVIVYVAFISGDGATRGLLEITTADGLNVRLVTLLAAAWLAVFAIPVLVAVPEVGATERPAEGPGGVRGRLREIGGEYRALYRDLRRLWHDDRRTLGYLGASALFRDGLAGVFTFGAVLGVGVYGVSSSNVLIFGVAANVVAAVGAVVGGRMEGRVGPKPVIITSLAAMIAVGIALLALSGAAAFWICGLVLCLFVGPAQASARSLMAQLSPEGGEGQMFGLYATTGRALSFLAPALFGLFSWAFEADRAGIAGLLVVLGAGLAAMAPIRVPDRAGHVS